MKNTIWKTTSVLAALFAASNAFALTVINTGSADSSISYFGETDTASYGQTFTVPVFDTQLDSFTLSVNLAYGDATEFAFYVMGWDGAKATGPVLYSSAMQSISSASMTAFTFTPGINLSAGGTYVGFVNTSSFFDADSNSSAMASIASVDAYAGGKFVFLNHGNDFSQVTQQAWYQDWQGSGRDIAFRAQFSGAGVPDGGMTIMMLGGVLAGLIRFRRTIK